GPARPRSGCWGSTRSPSPPSPRRQDATASRSPRPPRGRASPPLRRPTRPSCPPTAAPCSTYWPSSTDRRRRPSLHRDDLAEINGTHLPSAAGPAGPLRIGIGGPVGGGKTALVAALCRALRDRLSLVVVTNDIYTEEDA